MPCECELSVVIPCYRSTKTLQTLVERLHGVLDELSDDYEIILVNDQSPDDTWNTITQLMKKYPAVRGLDLARNSGQQIAVLCGLQNARGELIVTMDDDLQHQPQEIPKLLTGLIDNDADIAIAAFDNKAHGPMRKFASYIIRFVSYSVLGSGNKIKFSSFRAFPYWIAEATKDYHVPTPVVGYSLLKISNHAVNVTLPHGKRADGTKSSYHPFKLAKYFISILFAHSILPLKLISYLSLASAVFAIGLSIVYFTAGVLDYITMSGFTTQIVLLTGFFALIFYSIGILGLYLTRIMSVSQKEPLYHLRQRPVIRVLERLKEKLARD